MHKNYYLLSSILENINTVTPAIQYDPKGEKHLLTFDFLWIKEWKPCLNTQVIIKN